MAEILLKNVNKKYGNNPNTIQDVNLQIGQGEFCVFVGPSGCGKSTTGKLIDHLITPDSGEIWFEGKEISRLSEKEMRSLERIVSAYLDLAEDRAERHIPMTMEDWSTRIDKYLLSKTSALKI